MKLFKTLSALAVVRGQNIPDFSDLNALFASLTNDLDAGVRTDGGEDINVGAAAGARYVLATTTTTTTLSTTTATTTTTAASGDGCWKCDAMTFASCATSGYFQTCSPDQTNGDNGVCFLELRETNQYMQQLCTGCKDRQSCYDLRRQNFVGSTQSSRMGRFNDQCKPEWLLQRYNRRYGNQQSTCRTCFNMCSATDVNGNKCFGGLEEDRADELAGAFFKYSTTMNTATMALGYSSAMSATARTAVTDSFNLGIPLGVQALQANADDYAAVQSDANMVVWGGSSGDSGHGKAITGRDGPTNYDGSRSDTTEDLYLFWPIQDQSKAWWSRDHADMQNRYQSDPTDLWNSQVSAHPDSQAGDKAANILL